MAADVSHGFGGSWTDQKLDRLRKYLSAYTTIFTRNPRAMRLTTIYVDAFAGTGSRVEAHPEIPEPSLFDDPEVQRFQKGSARVALEVEPPFDQYVFVDVNPGFVSLLKNLRREYPDRTQQLTIVNNEANQFLKEWSAATDWSTHRAVVFLDPYGMQVEWETLRALAATEGVDLWLLFPLGQGVLRLLVKNRFPQKTWSKRLTALFGTESWKERFYSESKQRDLFSGATEFDRIADPDSVAEFWLERLRSIFPGVSDKYLILRNSKNSPNYLFCFAASNPKKAQLAVKIATELLT